MLDIERRLQLMLEAASSPIIVDINDLDDARRALNNSRGPCIGWRDYVAGEDYVPPRKTHDETPYGPQDGTAYTGKQDRVPSNPHSAKYGGIRPWSYDEVVKVLIDQRKANVTYFPRGIWSMMEKYKKAGLAATKRWDPEEYLPTILDSLWGAIEKDGGRLGTEFTKYLSLHIDFLGGPAAGMYGEHRKIRGLLSHLETNLRQIKNVLDTRTDFSEADVAELIGKVNASSFKDTEFRDGHRQRVVIRLDAIDPSLPANKNPVGKYGKDLVTLRDFAADAIRSGDPDAINTVLTKVKELHAKVGSEEEIYAAPGISSGRLISQPRDLPAIGSSGHRFRTHRRWTAVVEFRRKKNNMPGDLVNTQELGEVGLTASGLWPETKTRAERAAEAQYVDEIAQANEEAAARNEMVVVAVKETPTDDPGAGATSIKDIYVPTKSGSTAERGDVASAGASISPELRDTLKSVLTAMRTGKLGTVEGQANRTIEAIEALQKAVAAFGKPRDVQYKVRPDLRGQGGYEVVNAGTDEIINRTDDKSEADELTHRLNSPTYGTLKNLWHDTRQKALYGDYAEELRDSIGAVGRALQAKNEDALREAMHELSVLHDVARQDQKPGAQPLINTSEYRLALRRFGIDDYPEKGTTNDPEMDEHGNLSLWARAGYPPITISGEVVPARAGAPPVTIGGEETGMGVRAGTLHAEPGEHGEIMGIKHIARDLKISNQRVSQLWKNLMPRIHERVGQVHECLEYEGMITETDSTMLHRLQIALCKMMLLEMRIPLDVVLG